MLATHCLALFLALAAPASAQDGAGPSATATPADGPAYPVSGFEIHYLVEDHRNPSLDDVFPLEVSLQSSATGWVSPRPGGHAEVISVRGDEARAELYHASAIGTIARELLAEVHERGLLGIYVLPDPSDIESQSERDLRVAGNQRLRFVVWTGRIREVRTVGVGKRLGDNWAINNEVHQSIRRMSPLLSANEGGDETTDLLRRDLLEDYLFWLNRYPGRRVEASLAAAKDEEGIALDYQINEPRQWSAYAQVANTGTNRTNKWQNRFGYIHRQFSDNDDTLSIEYLNAGLDDVNGLDVSYSAPWFSKERPYWMQSPGGKSRWPSWMSRDNIPWWGSDRMRWRIAGGFTEIEINEGNVENLEVDTGDSTDWYLAGELSHNFFQHRNFFVDFFIGGRFRYVDVENDSFNDGSVGLWIGESGLRAERINEYSTFLANFTGEGGTSNGDGEDLENNLGRSNADDDWWLLRWDAGFTHYLEPLFNRKAWEDPTTASSSTLAHEISIGTRGQYAFDYRVIPQVSQVIGGLYSVRGFTQGVEVGDSIYIGTFEYRFHVPRALKIRREPLQLPGIGDFRAAPQQVYGRPDWDFVIRGFVDTGHSVRNSRSKALAPESNQTLVSVGIGLELNFMGRARARVDWGRGIHQSSDSDIDKSGKLHFLFSLIY